MSARASAQLPTQEQKQRNKPQAQAQARPAVFLGCNIPRGSVGMGLLAVVRPPPKTTAGDYSPALENGRGVWLGGVSRCRGASQPGPHRGTILPPQVRTIYGPHLYRTTARLAKARGGEVREEERGRRRACACWPTWANQPPDLRAGLTQGRS